MAHALDHPKRRRPDGPRPIGARSRSTGLGPALALGLIGWAVGPLVVGAEGPQEDGAAKARVASAPPTTDTSRKVLDAAPAGRPDADPIARARKMIDACQARFKSVDDYTCTFFKRERVDGKLYQTHIMQMKARTRPSSLYFKFVQPNVGREAIYIRGRNDGKILAHDVGIGRVVAGTMRLDPMGDMAMDENRHPITEAGIGSMIDTIRERWAHELTPENSRILFHPQASVGDRPCMMIESIHAKAGPKVLFHNVKIFIDKELDLPIRFEAYDWPARPGQEGLLMEEYTYMNLRLNVGLKDRDFDVNNAQYSFGRF